MFSLVNKDEQKSCDLYCRGGHLVIVDSRHAAVEGRGLAAGQLAFLVRKFTRPAHTAPVRPCSWNRVSRKRHATATRITSTTSASY